MWELESFSSNGLTMPISVLAGYSMTVTLNANNTCTVSITTPENGTTTSRETWSISGSRISVGTLMTMTVSGSQLAWQSGEVTFYFVRSGSAGIASTFATPTPAPVTGPAGSSAFNETKTGANGVSFTLLGARESYGTKGWNKADPGKVFLLANFEVVNGSGASYYVNTVFNFHVKQDGKELDNLDLSAYAEQEGKLAVELPVGGKATGELGWVLDENWQELVITISPAFGSSEVLVFTIRHSDLAD